MKKLTYLIVISLLIGFSFPQNANAQQHILTQKEIRKIEKKKRKMIRLKRSLKSRAFYANLLKRHYFVFQADRLYGPGGLSYSVSPDINFFAVFKNKVVLQFGFQGIIGWNGVGGLTAEGFLDTYHFNPGKSLKKALTIHGTIRPRGGGGSPYFNMTINDDGYATLDVLMIGGGRISMGGRLVSPQNASVFKGQTIF